MFGWPSTTTAAAAMAASTRATPAPPLLYLWACCCVPIPVGSAMLVEGSAYVSESTGPREAWCVLGTRPSLYRHAPVWLSRGPSSPNCVAPVQQKGFPAMRLLCVCWLGDNFASCIPESEEWVRVGEAAGTTVRVRVERAGRVVVGCRTKVRVDIAQTDTLWRSEPNVCLEVLLGLKNKLPFLPSEERTRTQKERRGSGHGGEDE